MGCFGASWERFIYLSPAMRDISKIRRIGSTDVQDPCWCDSLDGYECCLACDSGFFCQSSHLACVEPSAQDVSGFQTYNGHNPYNRHRPQSKTKPSED